MKYLVTLVLSLCLSLGTAHAGKLIVVTKHAGHTQQVVNTLPNGKVKHAKGRVAIIEVDDAELLAMSQKLRSSILVKSVEYDTRHAPALVPNDPKYGDQYHHQDINSEAAWDKATGTGVRIAVLDGGQSNHQDLPNTEAGWNVVDDNGDTLSPVNLHGTYVAGVAAAKGNNGKNVAGVAYNATVVPLRISTADDGYAFSSHMIEAIEWAELNDIDVIVLSYGVARSTAVNTALEDAYKNHGIISVVSAGNDGADISCTKRNGVLIIGATGIDGTRPSWSNYGQCVDFAAPGERIWTIYNTSGQWNPSGTSFAAPIVAGVVALAKSYVPNATKEELWTAIVNGTTNGVIDADKVLTTLGGDAPIPEPEPEEPAPEPTPDDSFFDHAELWYGGKGTTAYIADIVDGDAYALVGEDISIKLLFNVIVGRTYYTLKGDNGYTFTGSEGVDPYIVFHDGGNTNYYTRKLAAGTYTLELYVKLKDGSVTDTVTITFTLGDSAPEPEPPVPDPEPEPEPDPTCPVATKPWKRGK